MGKKLQLLLLIGFIGIILPACGDDNTLGNQDEASKQVRLGINASQAPIWEVLKELAEEKGIDVELIEFSDYSLPNDALVNGEIDMNAFQNLAFLSEYNVASGADIIAMGSSTGVPKGLYSDKYDDASNIPEGSSIAVSNDPATLGLDLKILQGAGLIKLADDAGVYGSLEDINENPKNLDIIPMQAQQTARVLKDVAATAVYTGIAGQAGFSDEPLYQNDPTNDEGKPYLGTFAALSKDKDNELFKELVDLYQEPEIDEAVKKDTHGFASVSYVPVEVLQETLDELMEEAREKNY